MSPISRGFQGRPRQADAARLPPGQYLEHGFPVLSAGPTLRTPPDGWTFEIRGAVDQPISWTWDELLTLPDETPTVDIHCVTKWSKLNTTWKGVSVDTLLAELETEAEYVTAWCDGGYTTNLPLEDVTRRARMDRLRVRRRAARPRAWRAGATAGSAPVLLEERQVGPRTGASEPRAARLLGGLRLPQPRRPVEGAAL